MEVSKSPTQLTGVKHRPNPEHWKAGQTLPKGSVFYFLT